MSTNLHLSLVRDVVVVKTGKHSIQSVDIDLWQTPTEITYQLLDCHNVLDAYFSWCKSVSKPYEVDVYDFRFAGNGEILREGKPIGKKVINEAEEHESYLKQVIDGYIKEGYELNFYAM